MKEDIKQYGKEPPHHRQCLNCRKGMQHDHHCIAAVRVTQLLNLCTVLVILAQFEKLFPIHLGENMQPCRYFSGGPADQPSLKLWP